MIKVASSLVCVTDFEATCWIDGNLGMRDEMEIIEIGSYMLDARTLETVSKYQSFVRPKRNPRLSDFCMDLTSIAQHQVDTAREFPEVLYDWKVWMGDLGKVTLASWGAYDERQLMQDCLWHGLPYPFKHPHFNIKTAVAEKLDWTRKGTGLAKALQRLGLEFDGVHHRGIDDARNIVRVMRKAFL